MSDMTNLIAKDEPILITGAGGFIGGHLIRDLIAKGFTNIRAVDVKPLEKWFQPADEADNRVGDLRHREMCHEAADGVSYVINLACDMGGMGFIENKKTECMLSVLTNTHMLVAAHKAGVKRYLYSSSACVYAADKQTSTDVVPLKEEDAYPAMPEDGYGWEKLFSERMTRHYREDAHLDTRVVRIHNAYGPLGTFDGGREKAPAAISRKVAQAKLSGKHEIEIWGDGKQTRSFMYVDDCVTGLHKVFSGDLTDPVNLGSSELVTINQLVDIIEDIAGVKLERSYNLDAPKGVRGRNSDNTLIKKALGWEPSTRLKDGLETTYAWIYDEFAGGRNDSVYTSNYVLPAL